MRKDTIYYRQVQLLVRVLTAINLFYRELPRLSVDIDLLYLPSESRDIALQNIKSALTRLSTLIKQTIAGVRVQKTHEQQANSLRLILQLNEIRIKVELSPVIRGTVFSPRLMEICETAEQEFGYAEVQVASLPDLYAGKLCAALDRQHPRDLFDVKLLFDNEGFTEDLRKTFLVFLISHQRPMSELLSPHRKNLNEVYETEFAQMTDIPITVNALETAREKLITTIYKDMTAAEKEFLLTFKGKNPQWELLDLPNIKEVKELPSVQWKLLNLSRMDKKKHLQAYNKLETILHNL